MEDSDSSRSASIPHMQEGIAVTGHGDMGRPPWKIEVDDEDLRTLIMRRRRILDELRAMESDTEDAAEHRQTQREDDDRWDLFY